MAVFFALYRAALAFWFRRRIALSMAGVALLGMVFAPFNGGAALYIIHAASFVPFLGGGDMKLSAGIIGGILAIVLAETWLGHLSSAGGIGSARLSSAKMLMAMMFAVIVMATMLAALPFGHIHLTIGQGLTVSAISVLARAILISTKIPLDRRRPVPREAMSRRDVLKLAGAAVLAGPVGREAAAAEPSAPAAARRPKRVIVAGGGIGGLCCAHELTKLGHDVTVLEAAGRTGGHVRTVRDPLADGLYVDGGAEHFTRPGYELFWGHVAEFNLKARPYHRRENMLRLVNGRMYTEEMLADPKVLAGFNLNQREVDFLSHEPWWNLASLYFAPYLDSFHDEYKPFGAGLDHLDQISFTDLLRKDGASAGAIGLIGSRGSALQSVWHAALLKLRGVPLFPPHVFRIEGGNQSLPDAFTTRLGDRVRLGCPVTGIERGDTGVRVTYRETGREHTMEGDYLVSAMSLVKLREVPVTPAWPEERAHVVQVFPYYTASRPVFQSRTRFWEAQRTSPNIVFAQPALEHVWRMADEVDTKRGLIAGTAGGFTTGDDALATFRRYYPGGADDIEQAFVIDWAKDLWAMACEPVNYGPGQLRRFWPRVIEPEGRIHFVGAYADNLNWGMEAATRSAHRVAAAIDAA